MNNKFTKALLVFGLCALASVAKAEALAATKPDGRSCGYRSTTPRRLDDIHIYCQRPDGSWELADKEAESKWLQEQAQHGAWQAMALLAERYERGEGLPQDEVAAAHWRKLQSACVSLIAFFAQNCEQLWSEERASGLDAKAMSDAANAAERASEMDAAGRAAAKGPAAILLPQHAIVQVTARQFQDVTDRREVSAGLSALNAYLRPLSPSITALRCDLMIVAHASRVEQIYAGVCSLRSKARAMVCGDTGVGEFGLMPFKNDADAVDRRILVQFTQSNCPGG